MRKLSFLSPKLFCFLFLLITAPASLPAQTQEEARAELRRRRQTFDMSSDEKRAETVSGLINAALDGEKKIVELYLAAGLGINDRDESGRTALFAAATSEKEFSLALDLLAKGADPNIANINGKTPLMTAIKYGNHDSITGLRSDGSVGLIRTLLDKGADVNARDSGGLTPLIQAALVNDGGTVRALAARGADLNAKDEDGQSALDIASHELRGQAVQALIESGAQMSSRQKLHYASYRFARVEGWILPVLIVGSFLLGYFGKKLTRPQPKRNAVESGDELPHLTPLKCQQCGAGVPLDAERMQCPRCDTPIPVPEDYAATVRLRAKASEKMGRAVSAWRHANIFTVWPIRWTLWLLAPVLLVFTAIGVFSDLGDSLFARKTSVAFLALFALLGGVSLATAAWAYAFYLNGTRKRLPVIPEIGQKVGEAELANCHLCGGGIAYEAGDLAAICSYCGGETYRVRLARRAHAVAAEEKEKATLSLYDAMAEIVARRQRAFSYLYKTAAVVFGLTLAAIVLTV